MPGIDIHQTDTLSIKTCTLKHSLYVGPRLLIITQQIRPPQEYLRVWITNFQLDDDIGPQQRQLQRLHHQYQLPLPCSKVMIVDMARAPPFVYPHCINDCLFRATLMSSTTLPLLTSSHHHPRYLLIFRLSSAPASLPGFTHRQGADELLTRLLSFEGNPQSPHQPRSLSGCPVASRQFSPPRVAIKVCCARHRPACQSFSHSHYYHIISALALLLSLCPLCHFFSSLPFLFPHHCLSSHLSHHLLLLLSLYRPPIYSALSNPHIYSTSKSFRSTQ